MNPFDRIFNLKIKLIFPVIMFLVNNWTSAQTKYQKDFNEFWTDINDNYAYLDQQNIDWKKVKQIYEPQSSRISNDDEFITFIENVLNELYNGHSSLNTNLPNSNRLVPSGSDLYLEKVGNKYIIKDLRKGFGADLAGLKPGMEVTAYNGKSIDEQLKKFLPKFTTQHNQKMYHMPLICCLQVLTILKEKLQLSRTENRKLFFPSPMETVMNCFSVRF